MVTRTTPWPAGAPCWVDIGTDVDRATAFYSALFGWRVEKGAAEFGGYANCFVGEHPVAGLGPLQEGQVSAWVVYLSTEDANAAAAQVQAAGGQVVVPPMEIAEQGTMAAGIDPTGAFFGLWQSNAHTGTNLAGEPGSITWSDQLSADPDAAAAFYGAVAGHTHREVSAEPRYATVHLGEADEPVAGLGAAEPGTPAHWTVYFEVEDADAAAAKVIELGGAVQQEPTDTPYGRQAVVTDDQGARFVVITSPRS
ncbi:putative enzyme related to lactoylglutathione lyase [Actinokineospora baliensis]|uniref:VOC family protein n=1 Tax=Actinokineospora baliensis TaxID=547056 RepID=UPI001955F8DC|nr:VOC family protein [Actinokineospora baliensis]MBM7776259.1 putative enzyme related to lactoylglutathione lyase [Actinokineospora baliensis]